MRCMPKLGWGRLIAGFLVAVGSVVTVSHAEVGGLWSPGLTPVRQVGIKMYAIGDDPDVVPSIGWRPYSAPGSGRIVLNPGGEANGDGEPSMLTNPATGQLVVAWSRNSANGFDIVVSRFADGAWSVPQVVVGSTANDLDPQLLVDDGGTVHLFYWRDGANPQVFRLTTTDLTTWSAPELVSQPGEVACRPAAAIFQGVLRVAYEVHDFGYGNSPRQVVLSRYDGAAFVKEIVAITNNLGPVSPQVHAHAGRLWVDWVDTENLGAGEVAWTRIDGQGHWEPIHYVPFANPAEREFFVRGGVRMQAIE